MTDSAETASSARVLIAAFEGWSDAGAATTTVLQHVAELIDAEILHSIGAEGYVDFQVHRPKISFDEAGKRVLDWPDTRLYGKVHRPGQPEQVPPEDTVRRIDGTPVTDLFLLSGVEPARDWSMFVDEIVELVDVWGIDTVIILGAMYSDAPHSRPIVTTVTSESPKMRADTDAIRSTYEGPAGVGSVLELALLAADVDAISLWAQVPHYVHSAPSPKATLALLDKLEELLDVVIPRGDMLEQATEWEENIDRIASTDEEMTQYIRRLEESRDATMAAETTGDAIALEFEKFLERDGDARTAQQGAAHDEPGTAPEEPAGGADPAHGGDDAGSAEPGDEGDGEEPGRRAD